MSTLLLPGPNETPENGIYTADAFAMDQQVERGSVHVAFPDPVYDDQRQYEMLGWFLPQVLVPGGTALVWYGGKKERERLTALENYGLRHCWTFRYVMMGKTAALRGYNIAVKSTALFWLSNPVNAALSLSARFRPALRRVADVYMSSQPPSSKHPWNKNVEVILYYLSAFAREGELVYDPFTGHGAVPLAAKMLGCRWLAGDIDPLNVVQARKRVAAGHRQPVLFDEREPAESDQMSFLQADECLPVAEEDEP